MKFCVWWLEEFRLQAVLGVKPVDGVNPENKMESLTTAI
jgi:hypothetical protein